MGPIDVIIGVIKAHVGPTLVTIDKPEDIQKVKLLVAKKGPETMPAEKNDKMNKKLEKFIAKQLEAYETKGKAEHKF